MGNIAHFFIGIAMAAGSAIFNPVGTALDFFKSLGRELLGASTEFFGDGAQGFLRELSQKVIDGKACKNIRVALGAFQENGEEYKKVCEKIFYELRGLPDEDLAKHLKNGKRVEKRELKGNAKAVAELSIEILFNYDFTALLTEKSPTFADLKNKNSPYAATISEMIGEAVKAYNEYRFRKIDEPEFKLAATVMVSSLKDYIKDAKEEMLATLLSFIANQNGGVVELQEVALSRYTPKYILNACPVCGYMGDRLFTDEATNTTHCAACGASYPALKGCEPDLWKEIDSRLKEIAQETAVLRERQERTAEGQDVIREVLEFCAQDVTKTQAMIREGLEQAATRKYLDLCLSKQAESLSRGVETNSAAIKAFVEDLFQSYGTQLAGCIDEIKRAGNLSQKILLGRIEKLAVDDRRHSEYLGKMVSSVGEQVGSLFNYAREQFGEMGERTELVLQYVENLCTKEVLEDKSNALGADIRKAIAISEQTQTSMGEIRAITATGIAQILAGIDQLRESIPLRKSNPGAGVDTKALSQEFEQAIRSENARLSGQIVGLKGLIEQETAENRSNFRTIIRMQEETKAILMANIGMMDPKDFGKIYRGRLPSRILFNDGLGGPFPCPYCGAVEDRQINNDDYCHCSVCGNKFLGVDPFLPADYLEGAENVWELLSAKYGRDEGDPLLATKGKVFKWRKEHTPKITGKSLEEKVGLVFLPDGIGKVLPGEYDFLSLYEATTLIIPPEVEVVEKTFFTEFTQLECIVFRRNEDEINMSHGNEDKGGNFLGESIWVGNEVKVYGRNYLGRKIDPLQETSHVTAQKVRDRGRTE